MAGEMGDDFGDVGVAVFDEDFVAPLRAADDGAAEVDAGLAGFHGGGVIGGNFRFASEFDAGQAAEGHIGDVADLGNHEIRFDFALPAVAIAGDEVDVRGRDAVDGGIEIRRDTA